MESTDHHDISQAIESHHLLLGKMGLQNDHWLPASPGVAGVDLFFPVINGGVGIWRRD
jgi:hypothetical protein